MRCAKERKCIGVPLLINLPRIAQVYLGIVLTIILGAICLEHDQRDSGSLFGQVPVKGPTDREAGAAARVGTGKPIHDWLTWRGPNRNGISSEVGWRSDWNKAGPPVLWQAKLAASNPKSLRFMQTSTCAVAQGRLFIYSDEPRDHEPKVHDFTLLCLDALSGKEIWRHAVPSTAQSIRLFQQAPVIDGDGVYMFSPEGILERLKVADGAVIWSNDLYQTIGARPILSKDGIRCSPLIVNGLVMVSVLCRPNGMDADVIAVKASDGSLVWANSQPSARLAHGAANWQTLTPATINDCPQVIYLAGSKVVGINIADGSTVWEFQIAKEDILVNAEKGLTDIAVAASPVVDGNAVIFSYSRGHAFGKTFCIEVDVANKTTVRWKNEDVYNWRHSFILHQGYVYGFNQQFLLEIGGTTVCLDSKTGKIAWEGQLAGEMILADGKLIVWDGERLHLVKASPKEFEDLTVTNPMPATGRPLAKWAGSYTPVLANGLIYCRNELGDLFCVDVR